MEYQDKIAWLKRYRDDLEPLRSLVVEAQEVRSIAEGLSMNWSGMPSGGDGPTKAERAVEALEALGEQIAAEKDMLLARRAEIIKAIESIQDKRQRDVLRYLYINGFSWPEVSAWTGYDKRYVHRLHNRAVESLQI